MHTKSLAVVNKFTRHPRTLVLSDRDASLSREGWYRRGQPVVEAKPTGKMTIGRTQLPSLSFRIPQNGAADRALEMSLSPDDLLMEDGQPEPGLDDVQRAQKKGGRLFHRLLRALRTVLAFRDRGFAHCLLLLAADYVPLAANSRQSDRLFQAGFRDCVHGDKRLADAIVGFLTGYPDDDEKWLTRIARELTRLSTRARLVVEGDMAERVCQALTRLKQSLGKGYLDAEDDPHLDQLAKPANRPWLRDWPAHGDFCVAGAEGLGAGGKEFPAFYRLFREASDQVHRIVRTAPLHPFFKVFLLSKYHEHAFTGVVAAALRMHQMGIADQPNPAPNEPLEAMQRNRQLIRDEPLRPDLEERLAGDTNFTMFLPAVEAQIAGVLSTPTAVTRGQLLDRLEELVSYLCQAVAGAVGRVLAGLGEFAARRARFLGRILNADAGAEPLTLEFFRAKLTRVCGDEAERAFVEAFLKRADPAAADLRTAVKEAFVAQLAADAKNRFAEEYLGSRQQIKADDRTARTVYRAHAVGSVAAADGPGLAGLIVSPSVMETSDELPRAGEQRQHSLAEMLEAAARRQVPAEVKVSLTDAAEKLLADQDVAGIFHGDRRIGELRRDGLELHVRPTSPELAPLLLSEKAQVRIGDRAEAMSRLELAGLEVFAPFGNRDLTIAEVAGGLDTLSQLTDEVDQRCRLPRPADEEAAADLVGAMLAIVLGEYMLAAPEGAVVLDQPGLSMGLGVLVEMVRHLGAARDGEALFENRPTPHATAGLERIDLSRFYRVPRDQPTQMALLVQHDYALTQQLEAVEPYLREVREMGDLAEALRGTGARLIVVSDTLAHHAAMPSSLSFLPVQHAPAVIYVGRHGVASRAAAAAEVQQFAARIAEVIPHADVAIPVLVSPLDLGAASAALPVIDGPAFKVPRLAQAEPGLNAHLDVTPVTSLLQAEPYLPLAAALAAPQAALGFIPASPDQMTSAEDKGRAYWAPVDRLAFREWPDQVNVVPHVGDPVAGLFHEAWTAFRRRDRVNALFDALTAAVVITLAARRARATGVELKGDLNRLLAGITLTSEDVAVLPAAVAAAVPSVMVKAGMAWAAPSTDGHPVPLGSPLRLQIAPGQFVELSTAWMARFAGLL